MFGCSKVRGQSFLEYAMLILAVVGAIMAMHLYVKGGIRANLNTLQDRINNNSASPVKYLNNI